MMPKLNILPYLLKFVNSSAMGVVLSQTQEQALPFTLQGKRSL
jgi:hypothetical protein